VLCGVFAACVTPSLPQLWGQPALSSRAVARWGFDSPRDRESLRLAGLRRHSMVGTTSVGMLRRHRVSRWGERQGRKLLERGLVGCLTRGWVAATAASRWVRISGMTCSVLPIRDSQPHWQLARRWPLSVRAAGLTVTLCPATCSLTEMVTGHLRSVGNGRTYPLGKPVTKLPVWLHACIRRSGLVRQVGCRQMRLRRYLVVAGSAADGRTVGDLDLGEDVWISLVIRDGQPVAVQGATTLRAGDEILALTDPDHTPDPAAVFTNPRSS
jgi:hypothetical protein